jgi:hypothetical protein
LHYELEDIDKMGALDSCFLEIDEVKGTIRFYTYSPLLNSIPFSTGYCVNKEKLSNSMEYYMVNDNTGTNELT